MDYFLTIINYILIYIILAQSYNLVLGYTGMIHVGHVAFMAIGAYASSLVTLSGAPFLTGLIVGVLAAAVAGLILAIPTVRVREDYLVAATLGMGEIIRLFILNERDFTGGSTGLTKIMRPEIFNFVFQNNFYLMLLLAAIMAVVLILVRRIICSPFGKVLEAVREDETASQNLGKNTWKAKIQILVIGAALAGLAGALYAHTTQFIDPDTFNIQRMIFVLLIVVFGGSGTFWGPIVGTVILFAIYETMRFLPFPPHVLGPLRWMLYAAILIFIIIFKPKGVMGEKLVKKKL